MKPLHPTKAHKSPVKEFDGDRLIVRTGPAKAYVFLDRRMGVTWPTPQNEGYYAIYGLLKERYRPVVLLSERQGFRIVEDMLNKLFPAAIDYGCSGIYAYLDDDFSVVRTKVIQAYRRLPREAPAVYDASDFASIERAIPMMEDLNDKEAIVIPENTIIDREYSALRPESIKVQDRIEPWQRYPAAHALAQVVCSWEMYPYKPKRPAWDDFEFEQKEGY